MLGYHQVLTAVRFTASDEHWNPPPDPPVRDPLGPALRRVNDQRGAASPFATRWGPAIGWAVVILVATSVPSSALPRVDIIVADKVVHFSMYAVFGVLVARSLDGIRSVKAFFAALAMLVVFGLLDEVHQSLVPGRSTDVLDWFADSLGALMGLLMGKFLLPLARTRQDLPT